MPAEPLTATVEQIERIDFLAHCTRALPESDREALAAVLFELTELRANLASYTDSSIECPRVVREERDRLRAEVERLQSLIDDMAFEDKTNDKGE